MAGKLQSHRCFGRRKGDVTVRTDEKALIIIAKIVAVSLILFHLAWAFYRFMPAGFWIDYHSVIPKQMEFFTDQKLRFVSHTDLNRPVLITFTDTLYCREPGGGDFERYAIQTNHRMHTILGDNRYTSFLFSPGVPYATTCYLDTITTLHLPLHVERHIYYSGFEHNHLFKIVRNEDKITEQCIETFMGVETGAGN